MLSGYLTLLLIGIFVVGILIGVVRLGIKEEEYRRKYGK
jgi:uncharacterized integral membrane protein